MTAQLATRNGKSVRHVRAGAPASDPYTAPVESEGDVSVPAQLRYEDPPQSFGWARLCIGWLLFLLVVMAGVHFLKR